MAKTYKSGTTSKSKQSPLAPLPGPAMAGIPAGAAFSTVPPERGTPARHISSATGGATGTFNKRDQKLETHGAQFRVTAKLPGPMPGIAPVQANGRIIKSYPKVRPNFDQEAGYSRM